LRLPACLPIGRFRHPGNLIGFFQEIRHFKLINIEKELNFCKNGERN
jgi:hypothetical protein